MLEFDLPVIDRDPAALTRDSVDLVEDDDDDEEEDEDDDEDEDGEDDHDRLLHH